MATMIELMEKRLAEISQELQTVDKQCTIWNDRLASLAVQRDLIEAKIKELENESGGENG